MYEEDGHVYVKKQFFLFEEEVVCKEVMEGCFVEVIGDFGDKV